ncbi:MAG: DUF2254 domain-containing protein [Burkholderiales bacterium]
MSWGGMYGTTSYARSALWIVPIVAIAIEIAAFPLLRRLDTWLGWQFTGLDIDGAKAMLQAVITFALSFMVFTFGSLLVAIQIAGGQLTPRIIATLLLSDKVVRYSVGLFVFTLVYAVSALNRLEGSVHQLIVFIAGILGVACMAAFLFLIDYAARLLRPVSVLTHVGEEGMKAVDSVYPLLADKAAVEPVMLRNALDGPRRIVEHQGNSQIILAINLKALIAEAQRLDGVIEFVHQVGDFVDTGEPLYVLYGRAAAIDAGMLRASVAFGIERTLEQDPLFAFRILVDIGLKALSPAINDPTTAVIALDQVHGLLRYLAKRNLRDEAIRDPAGRLRIILPTPNWEDYVNIACNEIRICGAGNMQVARRLRAMLEDLIESLPAERHSQLQLQLVLLDRTIEQVFPLAEDRALARIPDRQGLGGSSRTRRSIGH